LPTPKQKHQKGIDDKKREREIDHYIVGTPVVLEDKLFVGLGHPYEYPPRPRTSKWSYFLCLDLTRSGDVSFKSYDAKAAENKDSALVWAFGGPIERPPKKGRRVYFGPTTSTAAVHEGLVYITEQDGYLHCLDVATGRRHWQYDLEAAVWSSPYWVDGRVFVTSDDGTIKIFEHGRAAKLLATIDVDDMISATPVAANGMLYVATRSKLYAIGSR
jgi:outer membrane protein assembly factor BamB